MEYMSCSGCKTGWCQGCVPDTALLDLEPEPQNTSDWIALAVRNLQTYKGERIPPHKVQEYLERSYGFKLSYDRIATLMDRS